MTPYKPKGSSHFYTMCPTRSGRQPLALRTKHKGVARDRCAMLARLADLRAWDLLEPTLEHTRPIGELYDLWVECERDLTAMRDRLADTDLAPVVDDFIKVYRSGTRSADTVQHVLAHCRALIPADTPTMASKATTGWLTQRLAEYPGEPNTRRKVASSWANFFKYASKTRALYRVNPMDDVERPGVQKSPIKFFDLSEVELILGATPDDAMRALFATMYGSAVEVSVALALTRRDIDVESHEIRAAGTKTHTRDRIVRVADWAWPHVEAHIATMLPGALLWPGVNRWAALDAHAAAVKATKLRPIPLRNSRHHWAVRMCKAGTPLAVVAGQLGHASSQLTLAIYGRFLPQASDRAAWERRATERDQLGARILTAATSPATSRMG